jgi:hypothetical protein
MIIGGVIQAVMGVEAAGGDLEDIAPPLSATDEELDEPGEAADSYTLGRGQGRGTAHAGGAAGGRTYRLEGNAAAPAGENRTARPSDEHRTGAHADSPTRNRR